jgi:hypothetical protein
LANVRLKKQSELKSPLYCFTNCCHEGLHCSRGYRHPCPLDRTEKEPYRKSLGHSDQADPTSSRVATDADAVFEQLRDS